MNTDVTFYTESFGIPTIIVSAIVAILRLVSDKIFKNKIPAVVNHALTFIASILLYALYGLIFNKNSFFLGEEQLSQGICIASLSTVFSAFIKRLKSGKKVAIEDSFAIATESVLGEIVDACDLAVATEEVTVFTEKLLSNDKTDEENADSVYATIKKFRLRENVSDADVFSASFLIIKTAKTVAEKGL